MNKLKQLPMALAAVTALMISIGLGFALPPALIVGGIILTHGGVIYAVMGWALILMGIPMLLQIIMQQFLFVNQRFRLGMIPIWAAILAYNTVVLSAITNVW